MGWWLLFFSSSSQSVCSVRQTCQCSSVMVCQVCSLACVCSAMLLFINRSSSSCPGSFMAAHNCILLNWNVRGLNNPARRKVVCDIVRQYRATIVCVQESKLAVVDNVIVMEAFGPQFANNFCYLPADGTRGGIIIAASTDYFDLAQSGITDHTVSARITMRSCGQTWTLSAVYEIGRAHV